MYRQYVYIYICEILYVINHYIMDYIISMFIESVDISVALITSV